MRTWQGVTLQPAALTAFQDAQREAGVTIEVVESYRPRRRQRIACTDICRRRERVRGHVRAAGPVVAPARRRHRHHPGGAGRPEDPEGARGGRLGASPCRTRIPGTSRSTGVTEAVRATRPDDGFRRRRQATRPGAPLGPWIGIPSPTHASMPPSRLVASNPRAVRPR